MAEKQNNPTVTRSPAARSRPKIVELARTGDARALELFSELSQEATSGELVGVVVIGMYRREARRPVRLFMTGRAADDPMFAVGAMSTCGVLVQELALDQGGLG